MTPLDPKTRAATLRSVARRLKKRAKFLAQPPAALELGLIAFELTMMGNTLNREARSISRADRKKR